MRNGEGLSSGSRSPHAHSASACTPERAFSPSSAMSSRKSSPAELILPPRSGALERRQVLYRFHEPCRQGVLSHRGAGVAEKFEQRSGAEQIEVPRVRSARADRGTGRQGPSYRASVHPGGRTPRSKNRTARLAVPRKPAAAGREWRIMPPTLLPAQPPRLSRLLSSRPYIRPPKRR